MRRPAPPRALLCRAAIAGLCAAISATAAGCSPADPQDPATWLRRLGDSDPQSRSRALGELRRLRAKVAGPRVAELLKDRQVREEAAAALAEVGGTAQVLALLEALDTTVGADSDRATRLTNRANAKIADALAAIGDGRACAALLRLARAKDEAVRLAAAPALGRCQCREAVSELVRIVDDEASPPLLVKKALASLGQLGDPAALPAFERGLVLEKQGVSFRAESAFGLLRLGPRSVEPMLALLQDRDAAWLAWAREGDRPAAGTYARAAQVLGELGDRRAVPALVAKLKYQDGDPSPPTARLLSGLVRQAAAEALGKLGAVEAAPAIAALVSAQEPGDLELSEAAAQALVALGDRSQARELIRRAKGGAIRPRLAALQAAGLLGEPALQLELTAVAAQERKGKPAECARALQELTGAAAPEEKGACGAIADEIERLAAPLAAAADCGKSASSSAPGPGPAACWVAKLDDPRPLVRTRASYELGRVGSAAAVARLVAACADPEPQPRLAALRALRKLAAQPAARSEGSPMQDALLAGVERLEELRDREQGLQRGAADEEFQRLLLELSRLAPSALPSQPAPQPTSKIGGG